MSKFTMAIVRPSVTLLNSAESIEDILRRCEYGGRTCYKSEPDGDPEGFLKRVLVGKGHESVAGHGVLTFRFVCSRNDAAQIRTYRIANHCQESQRYVSYGGRHRFAFCPPVQAGRQDINDALKAFAHQVSSLYVNAKAAGARSEVARAFLPGMFKTEIVTTLPVNRVRHFVAERSSPKAQESIRTLANGIARLLGSTRLSFVTDGLTLSSKDPCAPHHWWAGEAERAADEAFLASNTVLEWSAEPLPFALGVYHGSES